MKKCITKWIYLMESFRYPENNNGVRHSPYFSVVLSIELVQTIIGILWEIVVKKFAWYDYSRSRLTKSWLLIEIIRRNAHHIIYIRPFQYLEWITMQIRHITLHPRTWCETESRSWKLVKYFRTLKCFSIAQILVHESSVVLQGIFDTNLNWIWLLHDGHKFSEREFSSSGCYGDVCKRKIKENNQEFKFLDLCRRLILYPGIFVIPII